MSPSRMEEEGEGARRQLELAAPTRKKKKTGPKRLSGCERKKRKAAAAAGAARPPPAPRIQEEVTAVRKKKSRRISGAERKRRKAAAAEQVAETPSRRRAEESTPAEKEQAARIADQVRGAAAEAKEAARTTAAREEDPAAKFLDAPWRRQRGSPPPPPTMTARPSSRSTSEEESQAAMEILWEGRCRLCQNVLRGEGPSQVPEAMLSTLPLQIQSCETCAPLAKLVVLTHWSSMADRQVICQGMEKAFQQLAEITRSGPLLMSMDLAPAGAVEARPESMNAETP